MALRLSGQLLLGICRIFSRKTRYLLEDCNEALLTLKMAFRPGVVDMVQEQTNNINMVETINEFDILMSDVPFELSMLLQPKQTVQPLNQTFISQQSLEDVSFEVGRDAQTSLQYSPAKDMTLDRSLMKESFLTMEVPRNEEDALGDQGVLDFGFDKDEFQQDDFDIYRPDEDAIMNMDLGIPMVAAAAENEVGGYELNITTAPPDFEVPSILADLTFNSQLEDDLKTPTKKRVVQRKRKNMMDTKIELSSEQLKLQLKDTADIETFVSLFDIDTIMPGVKNAVSTE
jgi:hypothetical protein